MLDYLYHKRGRRDLPKDVIYALCCMATREGQYWQIGTSDTLSHLRQAHFPDEPIEQGWVTLSPSELGAPAPFGTLLAQGQLLSFLSSLVRVRVKIKDKKDQYIASHHTRPHTG